MKLADYFLIAEHVGESIMLKYDAIKKGKVGDEIEVSTLRKLKILGRELDLPIGPLKITK